MDFASGKEVVSYFKGYTIQQNVRNMNKIEQKKEGYRYRDAPMTPRDHFIKRKLGVKGP